MASKRRYPRVGLIVRWKRKLDLEAVKRAARTMNQSLNEFVISAALAKAKEVTALTTGQAGVTSLAPSPQQGA